MYMQFGLGDPLPKDKIILATITRVLHVPFRTRFSDFRQEVRKALGRYVTFRSDKGTNLDSLLNSEPTFLQTIKDMHDSMLKATPPRAELASTPVVATFHYTPGFKKVTRITFP